MYTVSDLINSRFFLQIFVLAMPMEGPERSLHKHFEKSYQYLLWTIYLVYVIIVLFTGLTLGALKAVVWFRYALKKQVAATAQEERKGIKKSTNYATASHDVRGSLAGIIGLIDICLTQVDPGSGLEENLLLMKTSSLSLLGNNAFNFIYYKFIIILYLVIKCFLICFCTALLNNTLDRSKLEAGKATLEEEKFEVSKLLEDVADLFHAVGMKKDVDVLLDLCDGSVNRFDCVKGDRKKLGQILSNIVSNAVKFTAEGYVSIRAYARKPSSASSATASTQKGLLTWLSSFLFPNYKTMSETNVDNIQKDGNCIEFVFEVDDTGVGIPKDKQDSVFENYAQIKGTSTGQEGTGLGLGIVQSLVRINLLR